MVKNSFIEMTYVEGTHWKRLLEVSSGAKIRNRYNQVPHLTKDTNGKVTNSQLDTTNESQEVTTPSPSRRPQDNSNVYLQHMLLKIRKKTIWKLFFPSTMSIVFTSFKHPKLPVSINIPVTLLQIVNICMTAISPNSSS